MQNIEKTTLGWNSYIWRGMNNVNPAFLNVFFQGQIEVIDPTCLASRCLCLKREAPWGLCVGDGNDGFQLSNEKKLIFQGI